MAVQEMSCLSLQAFMILYIHRFVLLASSLAAQAAAVIKQISSPGYSIRRISGKAIYLP